MLKVYEKLPTKIGAEYVLLKKIKHKSQLAIEMLHQMSIFGFVENIGDRQQCKIKINKGEYVLYHPPKDSAFYGKSANWTEFLFNGEKYLIIHSSLLYAKIEPLEDEIIFDYQIL